MRTRTPWPRRMLLAGAASLLPAVTPSAFGNGHGMAGSRTVYVAPTDYVQISPTTYWSPTTFIAPMNDVATPTSYGLDRSYAYVSPTVYLSEIVPTSRRYAFRPVYGRTRFVTPTIYDFPLTTYPTTFLAPTTATFVESRQIVTYGDDPCCATMTVQPRPQQEVTTPRSGAAAETSPRKKTPTTLNSEPAGGMPTSTRDTASPPATAAAAAGTADAGEPTPPQAPVPEKDPAEGALPGLPPATPITPAGKDPIPPATPADKPVAPMAPGEGVNPADEADMIRRQVQKPIFSMTPKAFLRSSSKANLNLLGGKVVSSESGVGEAGVRVTVSSRLEGVEDVSATTDGKGRYAVRLADGDWTVKVTMPSGRTYAVSQLTVTDGQIVDDVGRPIPSLTITR